MWPPAGIEFPFPPGSLCAACTYDLSGLSYGTPCPECGHANKLTVEPLKAAPGSLNAPISGSTGALICGILSLALIPIAGPLTAPLAGVAIILAFRGDFRSDTLVRVLATLFALAGIGGGLWALASFF